ncbi:MAG: lysophospholipid acyltransferase family protein [Rhizobiaceae bacterium]|nr:lysophospholipid acyltransferase family protein [Rhizobiaceae bacterium]
MATSDQPVKRRRNKRRQKQFTKSLMQNRVTVAILSRLAIWYLKLVVRTNKLVVEPENAIDLVTPELPVIVGVWHGQHVLMPALPIGLNAAAMISRNFDGEVTARIVEHFGNQTIRASGGREPSATLKKGGMIGFLEMLRALENGENVVQTADIPKGISRRVGLGIVQLAKRSGAPIVPLAIASSRRHVFEKSWDKTAMNMPFGTTGICVEELVHVSPDADDDAVEAARNLLEERMNKATKRAYALTGNPE